jgi:glycosyltransferase involved in cell wall biosynthesis
VSNDTVVAAGPLGKARQAAETPWSRSAARRFAADVDLVRPDLVHVHNLSFGRVAAEAQAFGRPVITTGLGGLGELVDAQSGWVTGVDAGALADAIHEAAADDDAVATRGAKGRERHRAHFSPEATRGR